MDSSIIAQIAQGATASFDGTTFTLTPVQTAQLNTKQNQSDPTQQDQTDTPITFTTTDLQNQIDGLNSQISNLQGQDVAIQQQIILFQTIVDLLSGFQTNNAQ